MSVHPTEPWIVRAARLHPERIAIDAPDATLTNAQLERASWHLADELLLNSERPGEEIALQLGSGAGFAVALHACLRAGLVAVPIDLRLPEGEQMRQFNACSAVVQPDRAALHLAKADLDPPAEPTQSFWTTYGSGNARRVGWTAPTEAVAAPLAGTGTDATTPAVRLRTSGTTGPGTPVHLTRGNLLWNALGSAVALGQPAGERWLSAMPVSHVGGLTVIVRSAIGTTAAVLRPRFDVEEQARLLQAGAATITSVVPTMLSRLLDAGLDHPPNLRLVLLGGAPISPELVERAQAAGITVASTYGLSEASSQVLTRGRPLFCTSVALAGDILPAASGVEGDELLVRSPTLATGVAASDGWLHTGDRARRLPAGDFAITGRIAETIVTGGENVAPTEVERHLTAQPGITDAAVLGLPDAEWGQRLEARVVLAPAATLDEAAVTSALRAALPTFAVPKRITVVDELPRTPTGKLIRRNLR